MSLSLSKAASLILSGVMIATSVTGVGRQVAKAENASDLANTKVQQTSKANQDTQPQQTDKTEPDSNPEQGNKTKPNSKPDAKPDSKSDAEPDSKAKQDEQPAPTKQEQQTPVRADDISSASKAQKKSTPPAPIEPFIKADAVALGHWLVTKTVKNLVDKPESKTEQPSQDTKPDKKTSQSAQPPAPKPSTATQAQAPAQSAATAQTAAPQQVAVRALPPKPSNNPTIDSYTEMRVALTKQAPSITVAASQGGVLASTNGNLIQNVSAGVGYQVSADQRGLFINGQPVPTAVWLQPENGYVAVGDRWYRGRLLLLWQDGGVMAVNYVLLQEYLYSVVGAEMSASWSIEALKAQAVAARSYAIVHTVRHQRRAYDLDDTQRYQAYKGIATEASSTQQAVQSTSGEFISYDGGIVESLYAANQAIVDDAHSGYGMSQTGALDLAEQGYQYYEILSAYYPDTSVGRIDMSN